MIWLLLLGLVESVVFNEKKVFDQDFYGGIWLNQEYEYLRFEDVSSYGGLYRKKYNLDKDKLNAKDVWNEGLGNL
ncbi:Oidioi.mRNA.OKI2018_I69.chr2.g5537.t1.cds [Oikopleura dioica]|uniref:Oidioi.mRNA.OKI2018_I69.chr2.g5537.t1.cds n=1 Tax=Oikopleura dioica TaxID=34765 RepID=A0ABN7T477_OIKDI|nr:Oidioi.mRNA.OKI2018_I69.chr2.g5537.t1.cds [Oikopleura dioica]